MVLPRPLHKRILRWGNSYGIRLTRDDLDALGMHPDDQVDIIVERCTPTVDWDHLPSLSLGPDASTRHDQIIAEGLDEGHA
ncbi:MAG: hypothetical protein KY455_11825 [Euryarchaeota archaeon]|nr:hypothetical protein [Euryarchaeota archaeon]